MRLIRIPILSIINDHLVDYPTPINISYFWGFGSLAGFCLVVQIISGLCLSMHYTPHINFAFISVEHIMRDVNYGWLFRYTHANGASMFFIVVYIHMARGLYYTSYAYPRILVWYSGLIIFILMMATAFTGYVLPWGQMSFWGATVITNLFSAIPLVGKAIALWLWGGFSVDNATLNRFYTIHFLLPFLITGMVILHIALLHQYGSTNPLGICTKLDSISFYPYFVIKDVFGLALFLSFFGYIVFFSPNILGHPDNYIPANALITPPHIVPEWYFLIFYAILRAIPDKLGGVLCMGASIAILFIVPFLYKPNILGPRFKPLFCILFWLFVSDILWLGYLGGQPANEINILYSQFFTIFYFSYFLIFLPFCGYFEKTMYNIIKKKHEKKII
jgi:quinol-cytochrome oxidoreductase complex cytochrome b subunit